MSRRIVIIGTRGYPSHYGGFETAVRKLSPFLADRGWEVSVYGRPSGISESVRADARIRSIMTRGIETRSLSTLSYGLTASLHALRDKPDVALVMNVAQGFWLPLLRLRGIPVAVNVDGIEWERAKWGRLARLVFRVGARLTARFANLLVFDSRAIAERWSSDFGRDGVFIPYGGDPVVDSPIEPGLTHRQYALFVARFVPENSVQEFMDAVQGLAIDRDVVIVGSSGSGGPIDDAVEAFANGNVRVHWLGHLSDDNRLNALWQHAGVYFHGHSVGGTNPALVQAMACGAPILARDTAYNREVLGTTGLLTTPDRESIARAMTRILTDGALQERLSVDARARAAEGYSWEDVCMAYETIFLELLSSRRRRQSGRG